MKRKPTTDFRAIKDWNYRIKSSNKAEELYRQYIWFQDTRVKQLIKKYTKNCCNWWGWDSTCFGFDIVPEKFDFGDLNSLGTIEAGDGGFHQMFIDRHWHNLPINWSYTVSDPDAFNIIAFYYPVSDNISNYNLFGYSIDEEAVPGIYTITITWDDWEWCSVTKEYTVEITAGSGNYLFQFTDCNYWNSVNMDWQILDDSMNVINSWFGAFTSGSLPAGNYSVVATSTLYQGINVSFTITSGNDTNQNLCTTPFLDGWINQFDITDCDTGNPVPSASIEFKWLENNSYTYNTTNWVPIANMPLGQYNVTVSWPGYFVNYTSVTLVDQNWLISFCLTNQCAASVDFSIQDNGTLAPLNGVVNIYDLNNQLIVSGFVVNWNATYPQLPGWQTYTFEAVVPGYLDNNTITWLVCGANAISFFMVP